MFDRYDICEAYYVLESDWHVGGMLHERGRDYSIGVQLHRMGFRPRPSLGSRDSLTENGQEIYDAACERLGLHATA